MIQLSNIINLVRYIKSEEFDGHPGLHDVHVYKDIFSQF